MLEAIAIAMGESHLARTAAAQLAKAHQQKALLSLNLLDASLHANREAAQEFAATPAWSPSAGGDDPGEQRATALSTADTLEAGALAMRGKVIAGGATDADDLEAQSIATAESTLQNRLRTLQDQLGKLEDAAGSAIEGFAGSMGNAWNDAIHALRLRLPELNNRVTQILIQMGKDAVPSPIPSDPTAGRAAFAAARKRAVSTAEASFKQFAQDADLAHLFQNALDAIQHAQRNAAIAQMIVDPAALIGISLVGGAVGSLIGGVVRGAVLAEAATDTAAFARGATVARAAGAVASVTTDAAVTAIGQTALQGGSAKRSFVENVMINAMTIGALRPIHTLTGEIGQLDENAVGIWKVVSHGKVVLAHGASLTVEMLVAAGASYVAARVVEGAPPPNETTAVSWAVQGASIAVGKWIGVKTQELHDRWSRFGEERVQLLRGAAVQEQLARQVAQSGNGEQALALLEEHARLLHDEAALLADPKATARLGLDAAQVDALRAGNQAALADTQSQAYQTMKLRYHGLEPEAANGSVWSGTRAQIEAVLAEAGAGQTPTAAGRWDVELDGRRVTLLEVEEGAGAAPGADGAERQGRSASHPTKWGGAADESQQRAGGDHDTGGAASRAPRLDGYAVAAQVPGATYESGGTFRIATEQGEIEVSIRRTGDRARVVRDGDHAILEIPRGLTGASLESAVIEQLRAARGEGQPDARAPHDDSAATVIASTDVTHDRATARDVSAEEHQETAQLVDELAATKALAEQHAHEQGSVPISQVLGMLEETPDLSRGQRAEQIDLLNQLIAKATDSGKSAKVRDLSPDAVRVHDGVVQAPKQVVIASIDGGVEVGLLNQMVKLKTELQQPGLLETDRRSAIRELGNVVKEYRKAIVMKKPDGAHYDAAIRTGDEFFVRYKMILGHDLNAADVAAQRASAGQLGMQELRYSPNGKGLAAMKAEADHLLANAPPDADVSLTYAPSKNRTAAEDPGENEQQRSVDFVKAWYQDPKLQRIFNGIDSAGVEAADKPPATRWESSAQRTFRNAIVMREHLEAELASPADERALAQRLATEIGRSPHEAEAFIARFRAAPYDGAIAATEARAAELRARDDALRARRAADPTVSWKPALPALDPSTGELTERFDGLSIEEVATETRALVEALDSWSAETGAQHAEVTLFGDTYHVGEQILNPKVDPFVLLDQVDQAVSLGADRIGHALVLAVDPDVLVKKGVLPVDRRDAFVARQRQVIAHVRARGVVIEANMSSNMEISNLTHDEHPAGRFAEEGLRVTVNTDDETVLGTDLKTELEKVSRADGIGRAEMSAMLLEGYRSRMGNRELAQRGRIKPILEKALLRGLSGERAGALAKHLADYFHVAPSGSPEATIARVVDVALGV